MFNLTIVKKKVKFLNMDKMMSMCSNCPLSGTAQCDFNWSKAMAVELPCSQVKENDVIDEDLVDEVEAIEIEIELCEP